MIKCSNQVTEHISWCYFELANLKKKLVVSNSCLFWLFQETRAPASSQCCQVWSPADSQQDCHLDKDEVENKYALPFYIRSINLKPVFCTCVLNSLSKAQLKVYNLVEYISIFALPLLIIPVGKSRCCFHTDRKLKVLFHNTGGSCKWCLTVLYNLQPDWSIHICNNKCCVTSVNCMSVIIYSKHYVYW